jgi:hypothetical protein
MDIDQSLQGSVWEGETTIFDAGSEIVNRKLCYWTLHLLFEPGDAGQV